MKYKYGPSGALQQAASGSSSPSFLGSDGVRTRPLDAPHLRTPPRSSRRGGRGVRIPLSRPKQDPPRARRQQPAKLRQGQERACLRTPGAAGPS